jgi:hypothetical protein
MRLNKIALIALLGTAVTLGTVAGASADTRFERNHPRREQVVERLSHLDHRIRHERGEGEMNGHKAHLLRVDARRIFHREQKDARLHGGHITKGEQHRLNHREDVLAHRIGR